MKYTNLPNTSLTVSKICLGTMTWGRQNTEADGHAQLNLALEKGVNFIDTAEMYAVPYSDETQGSTERIIGSWLKKTGKRDKVILASKIAGPSRGFSFIRDPLDFSIAAIDDALQKSLSRLQTDYLDLYQLHWPERNVNIFGQRDYNYSGNEEWEDNIALILDRLEMHVKAGKIRHIGVSNETPFGLMRYMEEHRGGKLKMVSTQNSYNLLQRRDEIALTEVLQMENVGYLAYSPLAFGVLSGKYLDGHKPTGARVTEFPAYSRYSSKSSLLATEKYSEIAKANGLSLPQMALAFVNKRPFVTSNIIGATSVEQLTENIESINISLSEEVLSSIEKIHAENPNPAP
ncbi:MAG: aryl-alcohol dehydrogenase-like predicted oxidoreductase [Ulvibacter sp.]|jgi:aryl-alcohol dehydrogenase-like predicted oxidoreductase